MICISLSILHLGMFLWCISQVLGPFDKNRMSFGLLQEKTDVDPLWG